MCLFENWVSTGSISFASVELNNVERKISLLVQMVDGVVLAREKTSKTMGQNIAENPDKFAPFGFS